MFSSVNWVRWNWKCSPYQKWYCTAVQYHFCSIVARLKLTNQYNQLSYNSIGIYINKVAFWLSGNPLCFNMGAHWCFYFFKRFSIQPNMTCMVGQVWWTVSTIHMYVNTATCNDCGGACWCSWTRNNISWKVWLVEWAFICRISK